MDRIVNPKFDDELTRNFMLKLLPIQILLAAVPALNGIVSAYFASNNVGVEAMSAVGLYSPIATFVGCLSSIMVGGSAILCGQYAGRNERDRLQNIFSLNLAIAVIIAIVILRGGLQTVRGLVVNWLITASVGSVGISAYTAANNVLGLFWAVSAGMLAVSRTMLGISVGEEDRQTLSDIMKAVWRLHIPLQLIVSVIIIVAAKPLTQTFFLDPSDPVYMMTVWGFRILPLCMPLVILVNHSRCYAQMSNQMGFVNVSSILDGALCVCLFTFILIRPLGMNGVYIARVLNCIVCVMHIFAYAWFKVKHFPKTREELMAIPDDFGVPEDERLSLVVHDVDDAETVSRAVYEFCKDRGIDEERSRNAGLAMKELTSTIVTVGFPKDKKPNTVEIRVMHTDDSITMIVKDDCVAFPPIERAELVDSEERENNPGLSMIIDVAEDVNYQNLYGMNIWTIKI